MNILVTGAKGQIGKEIIKVLNDVRYTLYKGREGYRNIDLVETDIDDMDITDCNNLRIYIKTLKPHIIINCAAFSDIDLCETMEDKAFKVNALGVRNLAIAAEESGAKLIHISTSYVFGGSSNIPYKEYDTAAPINVYGKTKLFGEEYIKQFCSKFFIVRSGWLYGHYGNNFVKNIIDSAAGKENIDAAVDLYGTPTYAGDLAYHILKLALTAEYGTYHCTGKGKCTWYEFVKRIIEYSGISCSVVPVKFIDLKRSALRPNYSVLDNMMLRSTIGDEMRDWEEALRQYIKSSN